ncbi:MAG: PEP-CTERM sorting domain-containing protein, partial [Myxococcales bacterium]
FTDTAPAAANGSFSFAFVPEPGTGALLAWGLALLGRARRR